MKMTTDKTTKVLDEIDNYEQSLNACLTFIHIYKWDETEKKPSQEVKHNIGKKYSPNDVTPDITIQLSDERGLVVELKESLPQNNDVGNIDVWKEKFDQVKKYDVRLDGWETSTTAVKQQDLILLINQKFTTKVIEYITSNNLSFNNFSKNFCVIQYSPAFGRKDGIFLRKDYGKIDDFKTITDKRLSDGITVSLDFLIKCDLSKIKFLDFKPHFIYTMGILWFHVFPSLLTDDDWRRFRMESGRKQIEINVTVKDIRNFLIKYYAEEQSEYIREKWIEEALEKFRELKYATRKGDVYTIKWRKKISNDEHDANVHRVFADLFYKEGIQKSLDEISKNI
jgi:hypothetical protein